MDKWEYNAVYMYLKEDLRDSKGKKYKQWVLDFDDGKRIEGIYQILDFYGNQGWELVNFLTEWSTGTGMYYGGAKSEGYRAIFKRKLQE